MIFRFPSFGLALIAAACLPACPLAAEELHPEGPFTEPATGMTFPQAIGDFQRVNVYKYNPDGSDESAGYNRMTPGSEIAMTVYVFPSPPLLSIGSPKEVVDGAREHLCNDQFHNIEQEVMQAHPTAVLLSEDAVSLNQLGRDFAGHKAVYKLDDLPWVGPSQGTRSEAYAFCFVSGKWTVEYRVDSPIDTDAGPAIAQFMHDLMWTLPPE